MASESTKTVTVDRISNSGNPVAEQTHNGKVIHVPAGLTGETYEVRLEDRGGYFIAQLVHEQAGARPQQLEGLSGPTGPSGSNSGLHELGKELIGEDTQLTMEQRDCSGTRLEPNEYPGKGHRSEIASRHD